MKSGTNDMPLQHEPITDSAGQSRNGWKGIVLHHLVTSQHPSPTTHKFSWQHITRIYPGFALERHSNYLKKKQIASISVDEKSFHSLIFVLDEGSFSNSMLVSPMTNYSKYTTRLSLSTRYFYRAAAETSIHHDKEYRLLEKFSFDFKFNLPVGFWWYWT